MYEEISRDINTKSCREKGYCMWYLMFIFSYKTQQGLILSTVS